MEIRCWIIEANILYVEFNNDPVSDENCPIRVHKSNGCMVSATGTIFNQIPRAKLLATKKRSERRIFLEKDPSINTWFFALAPQFETRTRKIDNLPEVKSDYFEKLLILSSNSYFINSNFSFSMLIRLVKKYNSFKFK